MRRVVRRPAARADLIDIWFWSIEQWGEAKADEYLDAFRHALEILAAYPRTGVDCGDIRKRLRRYPVGSHHIYYFDNGAEIEIVRVLHQRMEADERLDDE